METIRGKRSLTLGAATLAALAREYDGVLIDIGTGDGRFVRHVAKDDPGSLAIGVDACRENLRETSHRSPDNALYVISNALALPPELSGLAGRITINFPWGSLIAGLLDGHPGLVQGLAGLARPGAELEVRINGGALLEEGWGLGGGITCIRERLGVAGFAPLTCVPLAAAQLRLIPTTWAKRLAAGRDPSGFYLRAAYLDMGHTKPDPCANQARAI